MTITLNGTTGITTPAVTNNGAYAGDGISFADGTPSNTLVTTTGGNVGIGTSSPSSRMEVIQAKSSGSAESVNLLRLSLSGTRALNDATAIRFGATSNATDVGEIKCISGADNSLYGTLTFSTRNYNTDTLLEAVRIDNRGNLLVGTTSTAPTSGGMAFNSAGYIFTSRGTTSTATQIGFNNPNGLVGQIQTTGSSTAYVTSSDYRLKENIAPMTGALGVVQQLKPVTYNWKVDGSEGQGFIAHELQEVVPDCVTGEKDAVDADGNPVYQGIDTSFLVATLTAAIQELKAELDTVKAEVTALKGTA